MNRRLFTHGFTLLELLVAITVLSVVSIIGWRGLESLVTTRERLEPVGDDVRALLTAFGQMERDLSQVANARFLGLTSAPVNVTAADGTSLLQIVRVAPAAADRATEVQTVFYRVIDGTLMRQATPAQPTIDRVPSENYETARLLSKVKTMDVRIWVAGFGWSRPGDTDVTQPPPATGADPRTTPAPGLEVTVERDDGRIFRRVFLVGA